MFSKRRVNDRFHLSVFVTITFSCVSGFHYRATEHASAQKVVQSALTVLRYVTNGSSQNHITLCLRALSLEYNVG